MDHAKKLWENAGADDAYYAVATFDKFKKRRLDDSALKEFFETGREHVEMLRSEFESAYHIKFRPLRALDFGCGVGRILTALAETSESVTGVDISNAMLAETRKNCGQQQISNFRLLTTQEFLESDRESYELIHSYIVLQHIKPKIGLKIISRLVERLEPGGLGMLHLTFFDPTSTIRQFQFAVYRNFPFIHDLIGRLRGRKGMLLPVFTYDLNSVFRLLKEQGCQEIFVRFSHHGLYGLLIFFRKGSGGGEE